MKAIVRRRERDDRVDTVDDPPNHATVGSDLVGDLRIGPSPVRGFGPFMTEGDILGHQPIGIVQYRWIIDILPPLTGDGDPPGVDILAHHRVSLHQAPQAYENFQSKSEGTVKVLLQP